MDHSSKRRRTTSTHTPDDSVPATPPRRTKAKFSMSVTMPKAEYRALKAQARGMSAPRDAPSPVTAPPTLAPVKAPPARTRKRHNLSDGESDSEDPNILYRSLRKEEDPFKTGLLPPDGHDPSLSASQHITAGSRAAVKGPWISGTRSKKVASAWAAKSDKRVLKFRKPTGTESYDMTDPSQARKVFPSMSGSSLNTAKASQEVVIKDHVPPENMIEILRAEKVLVGRYNAARKNPEPNQVGQIRSRTEASGTPTPVLLFKDGK